MLSYYVIYNNLKKYSKQILVLTAFSNYNFEPGLVRLPLIESIMRASIKELVRSTLSTMEFALKTLVQVIYQRVFS